MFLSIITINYNNLIGLKETILSISIQISRDFEFIIIDGGSTDNSVLLIEQNEKFIDYWISERDAGIYDAMNKGIARATGEYIIFLNSGDLFADNNSLAKCLEILATKKETDILYGDIIVRNHANANYQVHVHPRTLELPFFEVDTINHQSSLIRRELFREFGLYKLQFKLAADYCFFLTCFLADKIFTHAEFNIVSYDFSGQSSANNFANYKAEQLAIWNSIVPEYAKKLVQQRKQLNKKIESLEFESSYKLVRFATDLNIGLQRFRNRFSGVRRKE